MATFQKPENALKRAEELIDVGKKQDALDTLHAAIQHRKFRNMWTQTIESIMLRHLELCVELKKMRTAREGLYQYRAMCQAANIGSLEIVVTRFRKVAEEKVQEAKKQKDLDMEKMADFDEMEAPQTILLRAIQASDTRQQSQDRDVHMHFRFLWDTYKVVLDVLKSNVRLEEVYHETAKCAFEFCRVNQRPQEFKRLCENLRKNYLELHKHTGKVPAHQVHPDHPDTIQRTLETRCRQLQIATELDLWRESYTTATEIYELMSKCRPKPHLRSMYYEYLGQIFWKSDNHLFHAFACLKNLMFVRAAKQNATPEELALLASKAVLATLCVPFQKNSDTMATLELNTEGSSSPYEKSKKHAQLFNAQSVPTRDSISQQLVEKGLLQLAGEPCKRLFALIESDFTPLSLCQDAKPFLDEISNTLDMFDGKLVNYITPLKQIIFFRLMKQLSEVYANMTIDNFEKAASIVPFSIAEKWMANAARQHGINIQINYSHKAIVFGAPRKLDMKSMRQPLIEIGYKLQQAMQRVAPEEQHKKEKLEKQQLSTDIVQRIEQETKMIRQRKEEIERRKEESERRKEIQEKEAMEKLKKQEAREAEAERARQEEERHRREKEREEQKRKEQSMIKNKEMLEEMKKQADSLKAANLKVGGKKITEIVADDLEKIGIGEIEKAREAQVQRERQEKIRQRKLESKRVDHLARALREEEQKLLDEWADNIEEQDREYLDKAEDQNTEEQRKAHTETLKERTILLVYKDTVDDWVNEKLEDRKDKYWKAEEERETRVLQKIAENKIERARKRAEDAKKAEAEARAEEEQAEQKEAEAREEQERKEEAERAAEEERMEREEQEREEQERAAKRKAEREAERAEMNASNQRAEEKRMAREREIEERLKSERTERAERPAPAAERPKPAARDDDGADNWRSAGPRAAAPAAREPAKDEEKPRAWTSNRGAAGASDGRDDWRRRGQNEEEEERTPFNRNAGRDAPRDDGGAWRRGGDERPAARKDDDDEGGAWRRPAAAPRQEEPAKESGGAWRRPAAGAAAPARRDEDEKPPARAPAREPEKAAVKEEEAEDEGWGTVAKKKKAAKPEGGAAAAAPTGWRSKVAGGGDAGERRPTPPWKRRAA